MSSFKIIKRSDDKEAAGKAAPSKPASAAVEAKYIAARCKKTRADFVVRLDREDGSWYLANAFKGNLADGYSSAGGGPGKKSGEVLQLPDGLDVGLGFSCPDCGSRSIVQCNACGKITCYDENKFVCAFCGNSGKIKGTISSLSVASPHAGKKK